MRFAFSGACLLGSFTLASSLIIWSFESLAVVQNWLWAQNLLKECVVDSGTAEFEVGRCGMAVAGERGMRD
jgi:hypothetical protein